MGKLARLVCLVVLLAAAAAWGAAKASAGIVSTGNQSGGNSPAMIVSPVSQGEITPCDPSATGTKMNYDANGLNCLGVGSDCDKFATY